MTDSSNFVGNVSGANVSTEAANLLHNFWPKVSEDIRSLKNDHFKQQELPLARIKKIMKLDEDVKMISAEAPVLFSKACEIFVSELSLRAWIHTEDNKRRTLQRNDIAMAITKFDQFDFLIDIVPREDIKPAKRQDEARTSVLPEQIQYYLQMAQQAQQQQQQQTQTTVQATPQVQTTQQTVTQTATQNVSGLQLAGGQLIQQPFQVAPQAQTSVVSAQPSQQQVITIQQPQQQQQQQTTQQQPTQVQQVQQPQTQVFQQVITPSGQVENVPIQLTPQQLQAIQMQLQGKTSNQPIIITSGTQPQQTTVSQPEQVQFSNQGVFQVQQLANSGQQVYIQQEGEPTDS
ncbi:hypothetical protein ACF0H5_005440 [Mactra antiquata]